MKALLLAATSSLALTGFAMAQTATDSATTTDSSAVPVTGAPTEADSAATGAGTNAGSSMDAATSGSTMDAASPAATGADSPDAGGAAATGSSMDSTGAGSDMTTGTATDSMGTAGSTATTGATTTDTTTTDTTTTTAPVTTTTTDMTTTTTDAAGAPAAATTVLTADNPGMLGSWIMNRRIWTTNQPSSTEWANSTLTERPAEWTDIAKVDDIVVDPQGEIVGYVADIGGFLGLGAKSVLLNPDALHFVQIGDDAFFATNYTREELEALPDFDTTTVMR